MQCITERSVGVDKTNGFGKRKYEKLCDKHVVTRSEVDELNGVGKQGTVDLTGKECIFHGLPLSC